MDPTFQQLGIALLLGLLVGLEREHVESGMAGLRTFPLITVLGAVSVLLGRSLGGWVPAAALLGLAGVVVVGHVLKVRQAANHDVGTTTDVAMLLMFAVGALVVVGPVAAAVAVGGGTAVLLQFKPELHRMVRALGDEDVKAVMQFVLITCIILPVLPNQKFGPSSYGWSDLDVLNPFETWLMVVLIVGMSLGGYIIYKYFGRGAGILLSGVLGGAISSTATTVSNARTARGAAEGARTAAIVIMIASAVMYLRVLAAVAVVSHDFLRTAAAPLMILMLLTLLPAVLLWGRVRRQPAEMPEQSNPTQLKSALVFGLMYAGVLFALAVAKKYAGGRGLYVVAGLSGLTEMDAITLSTARMSLSDPAVMLHGWRLIVIAAMANLVSKATLAGLLGGRRFLGQIVLLFAIPMAGGVLLLRFL